MIGCLQTRVCKQPITALYFESETVLKLYNLKAWMLSAIATKLPHRFQIIVLHLLEKQLQQKQQPFETLRNCASSSLLTVPDIMLSYVTYSNCRIRVLKIDR